MKHAAVKLVKAKKKSSKAQIGSITIARKISNPKAFKLKKDAKSVSEKSFKVSETQAEKPKKKTAKSAVIAFPKAKTAKSAPIVSDKKVRREKIAPVISPKTKTKKTTLNAAVKSKTVAVKSKIGGLTIKPQKFSASGKQEKILSAPRRKSVAKRKPQEKIISGVSDVKLKNKNQEINSTVFVTKLKAKKEKIVPVAAQKIKRANKNAKASTVENTENKTSKNKSFVAINKIKVIQKKTNLPNEKINKPREATANLSVAPPKALPIEAKIEIKSAPRKTKAKNNKPIGAATFRGKKERYDFQVYPIDAEFDNVSAIYVISKRKIDKQKRGHHALVCIGQTDSILGELKKHKSKCVKKHNANVISILPEPNEKKRLKIEEDLKAAHSIACGI